MRRASLTARNRMPFIDVGWNSVSVLWGETGTEIAIDRSADGSITASSREAVRRGLRELFGLPRDAALRERQLRSGLCGISCRGVTLRRVEVPSAAPTETERLLRLQLEREMPVAIERLAVASLPWAPLGRNHRSRDADATRAHLVAVVRREVLCELRDVLADGGVRATFTLGILAAAWPFVEERGAVCVVDIRKSHTELVVVEAGHPVLLRSLPWGCGVQDDVSESGLNGGTTSDAEQQRPGASNADVASRLASDGAPDLVATRARELAAEIRDAWSAAGVAERSGSPMRVVVLSHAADRRESCAALERSLRRVTASEVRVDVPEPPAGPGRSVVTTALASNQREKMVNGLPVAMRFETVTESPNVKEARRPATVARWATVCVLLTIGVIALRILPPLLSRPDLEAKIARYRQELSALPPIGGELAFFENLSVNTAPYLEAMHSLAAAAPKGTFLSELSMDHRGEVRLRGRIKQRPHVEEYRKKLSSCGLFSQVVVQELVPKEEHTDFRFLARIVEQSKPVSSDGSTPAPAANGTNIVSKSPRSESAAQKLKPAPGETPTEKVEPKAAAPDQQATPPAANGVSRAQVDPRRSTAGSTSPSAGTDSEPATVQ